MTGLAPKFDLLQTSWPVLAATDEPASRTLNVIAPYTGEALAKVAVAGERHVQDALFAGFSMFRQKDRWLPITQRIAIFQRAIALLQEHSDLLALEAARESGKALRWCAREVQQSLLFAEDGVRLLRSQSCEEFPTGSVCGLLEAQQSVNFEVAEPLGLAVVVLGRQSPLQVAAQSLFAALVAGCPIIIKPAENLPLSCLRLVHLLHEAGLPYVWCQAVVTESHEVTSQLATDARVALFNFVGSPDVGWALRSTLAPGTRALLDHGSVMPVIVAPDANFRLALEAVALAGLAQEPCGGEPIQRIFVLRESCDTFVAALAERAQRIVLGDPVRFETELGTLPRPVDVERIDNWVRSAVASGAKLVCGGQPSQRQGYLPTVLLDPPLDAEVSTRAAGAPLVAVYSVDNLEQACERANALPLARSALVYTSNPMTAAQLTQALDATSVRCNARFERPLERNRGLTSLRRSGLGELGFRAMSAALQFKKILDVPAWNSV